MSRVGALLSIVAVLVASGLVTGQEIRFQKTSGPPGGDVYDLLVTPDGTLFAATGTDVLRFGNPFESGQVGPGERVFSACHIRKLIVDQNGILAKSCERLYESGDGGDNWKSLTLPRSTYATEIARISTGLFIAAPGGVFRWNDHTQTWLNASDGMDEPAPPRVEVLAVSPWGTMFAGLDDDQEHDSHVFRWDPDELRWLASAGEPVGGRVNGIYFDSTGLVWATTESESFLPVAESGLFRSKDMGETWEKAGSLDPVFTIERLSDLSLVIGTRQGLYRSTDDGETWSSFGLPHLGVFAILETPSGDLLAGTSQHCFPAIEYPYCPAGLGLFRQPKGSGEWIIEDIGHTRSFVTALAPSVDGGIYAMTERGLWHTQDEGASWTKLDRAGIDYPIPYFYQTYTSLVPTPWNTVVASRTWEWGLVEFKPGVLTSGDSDWAEFHVSGFRALTVPESETILVMVHGGVERSADRGRTWQRVHYFGSLPIWTIGSGPDGLLLAAETSTPLHRTVMIHRSEDAGETWSPSAAFTVEGVFRAMVVTSTGVAYVNYGSDLYRSDDRGRTWSPVGPSPPESDHLFANDAGDLISVSEQPVSDRLQISRDGGASWTVIPDLDVPRFITSAALDIAGNLYIGTYDGVYKSSVSTLVANDQETVPLRHETFDVYPNPSSGRTTFALRMDEATKVTLTVFDVAGRQMMVAERVVPEGENRLLWDASNAPPGLYVAEIRHGDRVSRAAVIVSR